MGRLRNTIKKIKDDFPNSTVSFKSLIVNYFYSPRFRVLLNHRIGKYFYKSKFILFKPISAFYRYRLVVKRNCDISYNAEIGKNLRLPHPIGIVIGDGVIIKDNVIVFQQVTFGSHGKKGYEKSYPTVENGVKIYSGAKIIGGITVGENAVIGANAVVLIDVPSNSVAMGIPAKIINKKL